MAIVSMQKVAIVIHNSLKEEVIAQLHEAGVMQLSESSEPVQVDHTEVEYRAAEVDFAIHTLEEVASKQTKAVCAKPSNAQDIIHTTKHTDVRGIVDTLHRLEEEDTDAERVIQELKSHDEYLSPWKDLPYSLQSPSETDRTMRICGTVPEAQMNTLKDALTNEIERSEVLIVSADKGLMYVCIHLWKEDSKEFERIATSLGWSSVELPILDGTPAHLLEEGRIQMEELRKKQIDNHAERVKLSVELPKLLKVRTFMHWLDQKQYAREVSSDTLMTTTFMGWIPKNVFEKLETELHKISPATALLKIKPDEDEDPPVLLKNSKLITPFESVTGLYGLPLASEMDPTRALSPFFILYFGLCLTDAGYGAVIALIFGAYLLKSRKSIEEARLPWLLFFGGIVTFFVSIPFGGWFGLTPEQVPAYLTKETTEGLLFKGQIWNLNAQSGIDFLQYLSLFLGLTHLFFGMFLAGQHKWIHGKKAEAFWMDFTSHLLLGAIILHIANGQMTFIDAQTTLYILYSAVAMTIWGKGYGTKWFLRPIMGTLGLVNFAIGMISNGLSYLRILALGLVTGAIAAAINQVAVEIGGLFPVWLGIPAIILIFLVGHMVSIALNTLGSFIHSGRLQFIEFFSQFFEGGGKEFSPFRRTNS